VSDVSFQTRARTIDHLGRGQIADCPTAVSELWKNSYDAYARKVGLHIFDGKMPIAAVTDDGHGMDYEEFLTRWLVVGTDVKTSSPPTPKEDRNGLAVRERQGEKGIGRLSVAFLGPVVLVVSKRKKAPFVGALMDWRLFENPFLLLADIQVPVEQFEDKDGLRALLPGMFLRLEENLDGTDSDADRQERLRSAWARYSTVQKKNREPDTAKAIRETAGQADELASILLNRCLPEWDVWNGGAAHGTALFVLPANHELAVWVDPDVPDEDPEADEIKSKLQDTLIGFVDPYVPTPVDLAYAVTIHRGDSRENAVLSDRVFTWGELLALEHLFHGKVDEHGVFRGKVKAFGRDLGEVTLNPPERPARLTPRAVVGPFDVCIGTFEQDTRRTSMSAEQHRHVSVMAESHAGLAIYRNHLRVMPYGRPQGDLFGIEERRSFHAGREFWSHRRTFGRVAITREENPNLKDKAGREGLIDNQAKREFTLLVVELLKTTARRFFGSDSQPHREYLPEIITENLRAKAAEESTQDRRNLEFKRALRQNAVPLQTAMQSAGLAKEEMARLIDSDDLGGLVHFEQTILALEENKSTLKLPAKPAKLGATEDDYRAYRYRYAGFCDATDGLRRDWAQAIERVKKKPAVEEGRATAAAHRKQLEGMLRDWRDRILDLLRSEEARTSESVVRDLERYQEQADPFLEDLGAGRTKLPDLVRQLEALREGLHLDFAQRYGGYTRVLQNLAAGVDVDALTAWSVEQRQEMQGRVDQLHALAQLGVTVELVGHELETHNDEIERHLDSLPAPVKASKEWRSLRDAIRALFDRLRFVTPLQLSGRRFLKEITGEDIAKYIQEFFGVKFERARVQFTATKKFRAIKVREYPARIYPVFINLVNNSLYWVSLGQRREILLDVVGDDVVIADTGGGVDPDDVESLFRLFFTRRTEGRGVGLYLCRANLAAGAHSIAYASDASHKLLPGANFVVRLRGLEHG
jgi:signal transduction histidine kinase